MHCATRPEDVQQRILENREQTKALLMRRLVQSHRQHKGIAEKRIAQRRLVWRCKVTGAIMVVASLLLWLTAVFLKIEVRVAGHAVTPTSITTTTNPVSQVDVAPKDAGEPSLRFDAQLHQQSNTEQPN